MVRHLFLAQHCLIYSVFQGGHGNNGLDGSPGVDGAKVTVIPCDLFTNKSASY